MSGPTRTLAISAAALIVAVLSSVVSAPVLAETPAEVVDGTTADGTYVARSRSDLDEEMFAAAVAAAAEQGISLVIVAPSQPTPDSKSFALRVRQQAEADATLLFGPEGEVEASVVDDLSDEGVRAIAAARAAPNPQAAADSYVVALTVEPERGTPEIVDTLTNVIFILLIVLGGAVFAEIGYRKFRQTRRSAV